MNTIIHQDRRSLIQVTCEEEQAWNEQQMSQPVQGPTVRLWRYDTPGLVLGCSQRTSTSAEQVRQRAGIAMVARQAGGGAVLVGPWMLSVSVALPNTHPLVSQNLVDSYRWIGELHGEVLRRFGVAARTLPPDEAGILQKGTVEAGLGWACFGGFSPWEVVVKNKKIVGLAQVRRRTGALFVAGVLLEQPDWTLLARAMGQPDSSGAALADRTTSLREELDKAPATAEIASVLEMELMDRLAR
ncbi:MAG TPA: ligase [Noviherbaspirillum sp.]|uniref:lipoate--protein ligase family protein n=1 Tax=Noviherbaspirillum sp. TaxID=1926288 RepID=UPI002B4A783B|nr:ligase [Noviherbaspirillum sp.]HJV84521.1 ligase [Noviherbaspirillum sp.]